MNRILITLFFFLTGCAFLTIHNGFIPEDNQSTECSITYDLNCWIPAPSQAFGFDIGDLKIYIGRNYEREHVGFMGPILPLIPAIWAWDENSISDFRLHYVFINPNRKSIGVKLRSWNIKTEDGQIIDSTSENLISDSPKIVGDVVFGPSNNGIKFYPGNFELSVVVDLPSEKKGFQKSIKWRAKRNIRTLVIVPPMESIPPNYCYGFPPTHERVFPKNGARKLCE